MQNSTLVPSGLEGYRTAEVTVGGVSTTEPNPKSMEIKKFKGLHFIGELVDVTGWLGDYNFQWAWSSGWVAENEIQTMSLNNSSSYEDRTIYSQTNIPTFKNVKK